MMIERWPDPPPEIVREWLTPDDVRAELFAAMRDVMKTPQGFIVGHYLYNAWQDPKEVRWLRDSPLQKRLAYLDSPYDAPVRPQHRLAPSGQGL